MPSQQFLRGRAWEPPSYTVMAGAPPVMLRNDLGPQLRVPVLECTTTGASPAVNTETSRDHGTGHHA